MTDQQPGPQIAPDEFHAASGAHYGSIIGPLIANNLELGKLLAAAHARIAQGEAKNAEQAQVIAKHIASAIAYEDHIHKLQIQVDDLIKTGPTAEHLSQAGKRIIAGARIKEAAPEDGSDTSVKQG